MNNTIQSTIQNTIRFFGNSEPSIQVLRLSKDGVWANPEIPVDDAAKLVLGAIDGNIKTLVRQAVEAERSKTPVHPDLYELEYECDDLGVTLTCSFRIRARRAWLEGIRHWVAAGAGLP